jgi:PadR family transcriptional regulator, regulatory protein PadR
MKKNKTAELLQGALELLILRLLRSQSLNGWDIMRRLQLMSGDVLTVTAGSLYPALHRLEARGLVSASWQLSENNRRARVYRITAAGRRQLEAEREAWSRFSGAVNALLKEA